jgi:hypothetical protein
MLFCDNDMKANNQLKNWNERCFVLFHSNKAAHKEKHSLLGLCGYFIHTWRGIFVNIRLKEVLKTTASSSFFSNIFYDCWRKQTETQEAVWDTQTSSKLNIQKGENHVRSKRRKPLPCRIPILVLFQLTWFKFLYTITVSSLLRSCIFFKSNCVLSLFRFVCLPQPPISFFPLKFFTYLYNVD